jgi:hypothetical protein
MRHCCGGCAELILSSLTHCPHCGHKRGSLKAASFPGKSALKRMRKKNREAKYASALGGGALHVTGKRSASKVSGGLPSLGKRR